VRFASLEELNKWADTPVKALDALLIPSVKLSKRKKRDRKVMVIHDYKNGYQYGEDDSPLGYFPHPNGSHYMLRFPSLVDVFVYFSHNRVTVPPVSWVNSLHRLGVSVLGTLIFENDELDALLEREEQGFHYVERLVRLTKHYGFDGWLINVETTLQRVQASELLLFIGSLRSQLHVAVPGSEVIWYDSFVSTNRVWYQNGVNERNYDHFDNTDMFLTNYWWDETSLKSNIQNVGSQGLKKLFVGVDVWGRGSKVGKGGLEIGISLDSLRVYSSNVGLFAPAWTYEKNRDDFEDFDQKFWIGKPSENYPYGGVSTYIPEASAPTFSHNGHMGFFTDFNLGQGHFFNSGGTRVYGSHWVNGSVQTPVPLPLDKLKININDAFIGGSCLEVNFGLECTSFDLFKFDVDVTSDLMISLSYKQLDFTQDQIAQVEVGYYIERRSKTVTKVGSGRIALPMKSTKEWKEVATEYPLPKLGPHEHFVLSGVSVKLVDYKPDLTKSWIVLPMNRHKLLLGYLSITDISPDDSLPVSLIKKRDISSKEVLIKWKDHPHIHYWMVYINSKFVGTCTTPYYMGSRTDRVRVDSVTRFGVILQGKDLYI
jgi:hypothetical protein